jgi:hypothetical protein
LHKPNPRHNPHYSVGSRNGAFQKLKVTAIGAFGYVISRQLAAHILQHHALPALPIDDLYVALSRNARWNFYDLVEPIIGTRGVPSTIRLPANHSFSYRIVDFDG